MSEERQVVDITQVDRDSLEKLVIQLQHDNRSMTSIIAEQNVQMEIVAVRLLKARKLTKYLEVAVGLDEEAHDSFEEYMERCKKEAIEKHPELKED